MTRAQKTQIKRRVRQAIGEPGAVPPDSREEQFAGHDRAYEGEVSDPDYRNPEAVHWPARKRPMPVSSKLF